MGIQSGWLTGEDYVQMIAVIHLPAGRITLWFDELLR